MNTAAADDPAGRVAGVVFTLAALGEIGVGIALVAFPALGALLIAAPLDAAGLLVARMLGGAVLALGITWWLARRDAVAISRCAVGFLIYNFAVGILFVVAAIASTRPALPSLLGAAHLLVGTAFVGAALARRGRRSQS